MKSFYEFCQQIEKEKTLTEVILRKVGTVDKVDPNGIIHITDNRTRATVPIQPAQVIEVRPVRGVDPQKTLETGPYSLAYRDLERPEAPARFYHLDMSREQFNQIREILKERERLRLAG